MGGWPTGQLLAEASDALSGLDSKAILDRAVQLPVPLMADVCVAHRVGPDGWFRVASCAFASPEVEARVRAAILQHALRVDDDTAIARVLCGGPAELCDWTSEAMRCGGGDDPLASRLRSLGLRSAMVVPVTGRNGVLVAITFLGSGVSHRYQQAHLQVAQDLARQVGLPLDNAWLFESEREARRRAEGGAGDAPRALERPHRLQEATTALGTVVTSAEAVQVAARLSLVILGASRASVWLLSDDGNHLQWGASAGDAPEDVVLPERAEGTPQQPLGDALREGRSVLLASSEAGRSHDLDADGRPPGGCQARVAVPLAVGDRTLGGLLVHFDQSPPFGPEDERFMLALAQQCAQAVERTRLFEAERAARARAERLVEQTRRMQLVTSQLSQALPPDMLAQIVCDEGASVLGASRMAIWVPDSSTGCLSPIGSRGYDASREGVRVPLDGDSAVAEVVRTRESIWLHCGQEVARFFPGASPPSSDEDDDALVCACIPLNAEDRTLGALSAVLGPTHGAGDEERSFLLVLAHHCAQALDQHRLLTELREAEEAARAADQRKDQFLALLGHELRNPLAPILTALELMKLNDGHDSEEEREVIERQARHLVRLVDDLLDISRITRGRIELKKKRLEMSAVLRQAIEMASPLLEKQRHHLDVRVPAGDLYVLGDEARLVQVFQNLLTNAAKYTPPGGHIQVEAAREGEDVVVRVRDDGAGIPADLVDAIFEPFVQGERTLDRAEGGLGIGLPLARSMVKRHGGRVTASSGGDGQGSEFAVHLPALEESEVSGARQMPISWPPPALAGGLRVLVVDDNADVASTLSRLLRHHGYDVAVCHDGPSALTAALADPPHVALVDIGLPVMSGYELATRLRQQLGGRAPALVAVTGYGQDVDRSRSAAAGFAEHLVKPVDGATVLRVLVRLGLASRAASPAALADRP
jgi:signal transduction histidine kinase/ActR/RegA family two-component response regulator